MVQFEKLSNKNFSQLEILVKEFLQLNKYRNNLIKIYLKSNLFKKSIYRNNIILFSLNNNYIGYIWFEHNDINTIIINDIYIRDKFIDFIKVDNIPKFNGKILIYQTFDDKLTLKLLLNNSFTCYRVTKLLKYNIKTKISINNLIKFRLFNKNSDEKLRCNLQNSIFNADSRIPLKIKDIKYEQKQPYYKDNFCVFVLNSYNHEIGYGQIIYNNNIYTIVNLGIINEYQGMGYGEALLSYLINIAYDNKISEIFIRVDEHNFKAINLYTKIGFVNIGNYTTWIKS